MSFTKAITGKEKELGFQSSSIVKLDGITEGRVMHPKQAQRWLSPDLSRCCMDHHRH
jgi:hypothetical protein